jgi:hypothetical protein
MIGQAVIGGMIFSLSGSRPHVERGWIKKCAPKTEWNVQTRNDVATRECGFRGISDMERKNGN